MQITPTEFIQLPLDGVADTLEIIVQSFSLFPTAVTVFWKVSGNIVSKEGTIILPQSVVDQWGLDDTVVKNYVLQQLNLTEEIVIDAPIITEEIIVEDTTTNNGN